MKYYKVLNGETITMIGSGSVIPQNSIELTKEDYNTAFAEIQAHTEAINSYVAQVQGGEITLEQVPEEYRVEVEAIINVPAPDPDNTYGVPDETYHAIIDDYTMELLGGGTNE